MSIDVTSTGNQAGVDRPCQDSAAIHPIRSHESDLADHQYPGSLLRPLGAHGGDGASGIPVLVGPRGLSAGRRVSRCAIFIIFHDCCHGSFFCSRRANRVLGFITGVLSSPPTDSGAGSMPSTTHTVGDLDRRGVGDIWTLTVEEFQAAPRWKRLAYRIIAQSPVRPQRLAPLLLFLISTGSLHARDRKRSARASSCTNLGAGGDRRRRQVTIGIETYLMIQLPVAGASPERRACGCSTSSISSRECTGSATRDWDYDEGGAARGARSTSCRRVLQWFTGNIGFHHIHHLQLADPELQP